MTAKPGAQSKRRRRSRLWYLLPIFLQVIGGLITYFMLKGSDYAIARNSLWIGIVLTAITTLAAILLYENFQSDMTAAQQRIANGGSKIANTAHGTLEYAAVGNGYPVLVIHGAGGGYDQGLLLSKIFFGEDSSNQFRVIAPSRFGFLHTPIPDGSSSNNNQKSSFAAQADAYVDLLDKLNIKKVAVVGFSAGGPSSIEFALRHPDKISGLVLVSAVVHKEPPMNFMDDVIHNGFFKSDFAFWFVGKYLQPQLLSFLGVSSDVQARLTQQDKSWVSNTFIPSMNPISLRQSGMLNDRINFVSNDYPLDRIDVPTLVIHAKDDTLVNPSHCLDAAQNIPNAHHIEFDSGGHILLGHFQDTKSDITNFFRQNKIIAETSAVAQQQ